MTARSLSRAKRAISKYKLTPNEVSRLIEHAQIVRHTRAWELVCEARRTKQPLYIHNLEQARQNAMYRSLIGQQLRVEKTHPRLFDTPRFKLSGINAVFAMGVVISLDLRLEPCPAGLAYRLTGGE